LKQLKRVSSYIINDAKRRKYVCLDDVGAVKVISWTIGEVCVSVTSSDNGALFKSTVSQSISSSSSDNSFDEVSMVITSFPFLDVTSSTPELVSSSTITSPR